ncbi:cupin domain-containing protein [Lyngbya sp. CCAP 1446/10]|uniref:cupin domain-containing protein n=1 Tax=Lyngbya sp. CCAP 1446/10 TaxID=439293 RepID=UPI0022385F0C|nr:cupin domain-containing protein [Lyngbya sp. CCAP 1446/10]MCW6052461.1 cupin domain-containing protein [Lyngbya sp. CCAP 1446/10]
MTATILPLQSSSIQLRDTIEYPATGVLTKILVKDNNCQHTLLCLAAGSDISEHHSARNATINVVAGKGILTLEGKDIVLEPGVFVFMPARAPHALKAEENLAFVLTFSETK